MASAPDPAAVGAPAEGSDPLARVLELGLAAVVVLAPLPFAAVPAGGRLVLELGAFLLALIWIGRSWVRPTWLPPRMAVVGLVGLALLAVAQIVPAPSGLVELLSPRTVALREMTEPGGADLAAERRILGTDPAALGPAPTLSIDPGAGASALRTGVAIGLLFLVASTVAATRGARWLAGALLVSAALQSLYGILVLSSGHDRIWGLPKTAYLQSATGTFVNRNHFACFLAMSLACGLALVLDNLRRRAPSPGRRGLAAWLGGDGSRNLILALLLTVGLAGLLASLSRAGIALGLLAISLTALAGGRAHRLRIRVVLALLLVAAASVPLIQLGADRLATRYARSAEDFVRPGSRATVWGDTLAMARAHPWVGTGYGTFAAAYPVYRSPEVRYFYSHAHNDLLQAAAEGGLLGIVFLGLLLVPLLGALVRCLAGAGGVLAVGFAAGLTALLLHGLIDFNFHIPANAATGAVLAGALLGLRWNAPD